MFLLLLLLPDIVPAQDTIRLTPVDTLAVPVHTLPVPDDSLPRQDTLRGAGKKERLKARVDYKSADSLRFEVKNQKVFLFRKADIKYDDIHLEAGLVEIDFSKTKVSATGIPDSTGKLTEIPEFSQGDQKFKSKVIDYNYESKQGYIQTVITKQDEGYLHGQIVKKMENDITYIRNGSYTTCDLEENPHFQFRFGKAKIIPGKRVITGPAYMEVSQVATPLLIPFGYFPNRTGRRSGIILPTYGESDSRGFFLQQGGYYWSINDYMDLKVVGDIYSHGSWAITPLYRYNYRYHFNGFLKLGYAYNRIGAGDSPDLETKKDFEIRRVHNQDAKARPRSSFSANVNIISNTYNTYNLSSSTEAYLSNTYQSSINYSTNWNNVLYFSMNLNHSQNTLNKTFSITLPQISLWVSQFYPLRKKNRAGKIRWFENISMKYNLDAENRYNTLDSLLFKPGWVNELQNGIRHSIPISGTFRVLKFLNWSNSINMMDRMYFKSIHKKYIVSPTTGIDSLVTEEINGFRNAFDMSLSTSLSTRIYGMFQFRKGPLIAIRHMMVPTVSFSYTPNFGAPFWGYWKNIENDTNQVNPQKYSIFQEGIYGTPPPQEAGILNLSLSNNLEMKVRNRKDTVTGTKKIKLIEDFTIRASYDIAKDSVKWSKISLSGYTTLFKSLKINYSSTWDPYARDSLGRRTNTSEWKMHHRLLRLDNTTWTVGLNYSLSSDKLGKKKTSARGTPEEQQDIEDFYDYYIDFDIPWSFSVSYNFSYVKDWNASSDKRVGKVIQSINFNGQMNITPKWKVSLITGYDFQSKQLTYTRVDIYRDLHCWEMRFGWVPKGGQQQWDFSINVKASILQDMKLNKKKDFRDYTE